LIKIKEALTASNGNKTEAIKMLETQGEKLLNKIKSRKGRPSEGLIGC